MVVERWTRDNNTEWITGSVLPGRRSCETGRGSQEDSSLRKGHLYSSTRVWSSPICLPPFAAVAENHEQQNTSLSSALGMLGHNMSSVMSMSICLIFQSCLVLTVLNILSHSGQPAAARQLISYCSYSLSLLLLLSSYAIALLFHCLHMLWVLRPPSLNVVLSV